MATQLDTSSSLHTFTTAFQVLQSLGKLFSKKFSLKVFQPAGSPGLLWTGDLQPNLVKILPIISQFWQ